MSIKNAFNTSKANMPKPSQLMPLLRSVFALTIRAMTISKQTIEYVYRLALAIGALFNNSMRALDASGVRI